MEEEAARLVEAARAVVTPSFSFSYRTGLINQPVAQNSGISVQQFLGGANYGAVNYTGGLTLSYTFGNALPMSQDMRWRGVDP